MLLRFVVTILLLVSATTIGGVAQETFLTPEQLRLRAEQSDWLLRKWVLLSWSGPAYSGGIEFKLEPDGFISGYIFDPPVELQEMGYDDGMKVVHGFTDTSSALHPGATWSNQAHGSWFYRPTKRNRHSKKLPAEWMQRKTSVIYVDQKSGTLRGSSLLENRPNWYTGKFVPKDLRPLEVQLDEYLAGQQAVVERVSLLGEDERMEMAEQIIRDLSAYSDIQDVRRAIAVLTLLQERREIMLGSELEAAIEKLEASSSPDQETEAWYTFRSELLSRSAHFSRALANLQLSDEDASGLFSVTNDGIELRDALDHIADARLPESLTRLNYNLGILYGVAGTVRGVEEQHSGQLVEELRTLVSNNPATKSLSGVLDIPAEIVASIIGIAREGYLEAAGALGGLKDAIQGDRTAMGRSFAHARRLDKVLSGRNYANAIISSIGKRLDRYSVIRTVASWF